MRRGLKNPLLPVDAIYDVQEGYCFVRTEVIDHFDRQTLVGKGG